MWVWGNCKHTTVVVGRVFTVVVGRVFTVVVGRVFTVVIFSRRLAG